MIKVLALNFLVGLGLSVISTSSYADMVSIYGPSSFKAGLVSPKTYNASINGIQSQNVQGSLVVINGDGKDLVLPNCSIGTIPQQLKCAVEYLKISLKMELERPAKPEIYWNGLLIVDSNNLPQSKGRLEIPISVQAANQLQIKLKGMPTSYLSLQVKSETQKPNQMPLAQIAATPDSGIAPEFITFSGLLSSDPDGDLITDYSWGNFERRKN